MSTCARCGAPIGVDTGECDGERADTIGTVMCRDRELANLRSLLRSVTGKLEEAHDMIDGVPGSDAEHSKMLIASVLEALS